MKPKLCNNCYWKIPYKNETHNFCGYYKTQPHTKICDNHNYQCEHCSWDFQGVQRYQDMATYVIGNEVYCEKCAASAVGIEIREYTAYQYYDAHGNFLGDSNEVGLDDVLRNCSFVECTEDN